MLPAALAVVFVVRTPRRARPLAHLFRRLTDAPPVVRFVSTVGLWVAIPAFTKLLFGTTVAGGEVLGSGLRRQPARGVRLPRRDHQLEPGDVRHHGSSRRARVRRAAAVHPVRARHACRGRLAPDRQHRRHQHRRSSARSPGWSDRARRHSPACCSAPIVGLGEVQFTLLLVVSFAAAVVGRLRACRSPSPARSSSACSRACPRSTRTTGSRTPRRRSPRRSRRGSSRASRSS